SALSLVLLFWILILFNVLRGGIYLRRRRFRAGRQNYEIRDFFIPLEPKENFREIVAVGQNAIVSRIFLSPRPDWAYFPFIPAVLQLHRLKRFKRALILGGGGGSVIYNLGQNYPSLKIDVVEKYPTMITMTKQYFLPKLTSQPSLTFYNLDAAVFVNKAPSRYDFIFVDLFEVNTIPKQCLTKHFILKLRSLLAANGLMIVNFGYSGRIDKLVTLYREFFPNLSLFLWKKNFVGVGGNHLSNQLNLVATKII
ncbi:MAG: spermidine synthase, partial [Patescibacteria group bacterium]